MVVLLLVVLLTAACTSATGDAVPTVPPSLPAEQPARPTEPAGTPVVGVVVAPQTGQDQVVERLRDLVVRRDEVDWLVATAAERSLVGDLAGGLVDQGATLVCVVGYGFADVVSALARAVPTTRFCVGPTGAPEDAVDEVLYVDVRVEETAYLAGAVAGLVDPEGPVGVVTGPATYRGPAQFQSYRRGLADVGGPDSATTTGPVRDDDDARDAVATQFADGHGVILAVTGPFDEGVVEVAGDVADARAAAASEDAPPRPTGVIVGPLDTADAALPDAVVAVVRLRPEQILGPALDRLLTRWEGGVASVGLTENAVSFDLAATPLALPHVDRLNQLRGEIAAGDRDPG